MPQLTVIVLNEIWVVKSYYVCNRFTAFFKGGYHMRSSKKEYEEVAKRCSSYAKTSSSELSNCVNCDCTSCLNCEHLAQDEHCTLDLYDSIAKTL
jgi:hypothetical protein